MTAAILDSPPYADDRDTPAETSPLVLVVDDSPLDRLLAGKLVAKTDGFRVAYATNGREALEAMARETPAIVLTTSSQSDCFLDSCRFPAAVSR